MKINSQNNILFTDKMDISERMELLKILEASKDYSKSILSWFLYIRNHLNIDALLANNEMMPDEIENLNAFQQEMSGEEYTDYDIGSFSNIGKPKDQIIISTRHSSKGLEFEVVVMMGMEDDRFPNYYAKQDIKAFEETKRLCFVCVSRAKSICILMRSKFHTIKTKKGDLWRKPYMASVFWMTLYSRFKDS